MRPKLLEVEGLQSFRDVQKIDFDGLGETGLFGIFGPTGSGKSTVLDAITFALYGKVKRAERGTQGIINTNLNTAKVAFTFELQKEGGRKTYRVERTYQRKKGTDNACEPKVVRLIEITEVGEIPLCDKASDVSNSIEELLGLSHDDFTRAVVLPQNSFQEFLMLDNKNKREMLERIFYLEKYGKVLSEKLALKLAKLKNRLDMLTMQLGEYSDASAEALAEAHSLLQEAMATKTTLEQELKTIELQYNEAKDVWQLTQELAGVKQREAQHIAAQGDIDLKRTSLAQAVKADGLQEPIRRNKELTDRLAVTKNNLQEIMDKLPAITAGLMAKRDAYEALKRNSVREQPLLVEHKTRLTDALGIKSDMSILQTKIAELKAAASGLDAQIAAKNAAINNSAAELVTLAQNSSQLCAAMESVRVEPEYRQKMLEGAELENEVKTLKFNVTERRQSVELLHGVVGGLENSLNGLSAQLEQSQQALAKMQVAQQEHAAAKPEDSIFVLQYREKINSLQNTYHGLKLSASDLAQMEEKLKRLQSACQEATDKKLALAEGVALAHATHEKYQLNLDNALIRLEQNAAYQLADNLREGEACPVCGSVHHPQPATRSEGSESEVIEQQVEECRRQLTKAEQAYRVMDKEYLIATEQLRGLTEQLNQATQELQAKSAEYTAAKLTLPEGLKGLELTQIELELVNMQELAEQKLADGDRWQQQQTEYQTEIAKLIERAAADKVAATEIAGQLKVNLENRLQAEQAQHEAITIFNAKQYKHQEFLQQHQIASVAAELNRLADNDRKLNVLQQRLAEIQALIGQKTELVDKLKEELAQLSNRRIEVQTEGITVTRQLRQGQSKLQELAGDSDIETEIKLIDAKLAQYVELDTKYQDAVKVLETEHNALSGQRATLENQRKIFTESFQAEAERLNKALDEHGFKDIAAVEECLLSGAEQQVLQTAVREYDEASGNIRAHLAMLGQKLASRSITADEWQALSSEYQVKLAAKENSVAHYEVAKNNVQQLEIRHVRWVELNKSYREQNDKYGLFDQIQKLLRAERGKDNSFIDYIAEERLRYVAAKASETLGIMTKYKYALELDTNAGFIIRDNANGGAYRTVNSLSGGETFLTALSLALSLSEQIQLKGQSPLELFFLDEGFGTLDNSLLDAVIDSLERLSKKERVIGLISHVPELRNRIARRLLVTPPSTDGAGSRVKLERA